MPGHTVHTCPAILDIGLMAAVTLPSLQTPSSRSDDHCLIGNCPTETVPNKTNAGEKQDSILLNFFNQSQRAEYDSFDDH